MLYTKVPSPTDRYFRVATRARAIRHQPHLRPRTPRSPPTPHSRRRITTSRHHSKAKGDGVQGGSGAAAAQQDASRPQQGGHRLNVSYCTCCVWRGTRESNADLVTDGSTSKPASSALCSTLNRVLICKCTWVSTRMSNFPPRALSLVPRGADTIRRAIHNFCTSQKAVGMSSGPTMQSHHRGGTFSPRPLDPYPSRCES